MWPFKKKTQPPAEAEVKGWLNDLAKTSAPPSSVGKGMPEDWREKLRACNFQLAKNEIQRFFDFSTHEAERGGGHAVYRVEFVRGWQAFAERPCLETAVAWIEGAPGYTGLIWGYFAECCPGGRWSVWDSQLSHLKRDEGN